MLVISAIKYPNSKTYHTVLKLLNIFQGWLFTVSILKFLCYVIRVDRGTAGHVKYKQSSLCSVDARKATSLGCFCSSCASECNLWGVSEVRRHLWLLLDPSTAILQPILWNELLQRPEPYHNITWRLWVCISYYTPILPDLQNLLLSFTSLRPSFKDESRNFSPSRQGWGCRF